MSDKCLVGVAGVHFVVGELSRRGWVALPTIRNAKGIDVLADKEGKSVRIQVKARANGKSWILTKAAETLVGNDLYYVFVDLRELEAPDYFIIPSSIVAQYVSETHKSFLKAQGKDSNMRKLPNCYEPNFDLTKFKDRWESLLE